MNRKRYLVITVIVVAAVLLAILLDGMLANHLPAITSLEAEPERVLPSGSCQIMCTATDHDGDELSYNWSASGGEINGEGATVTWTAPHPAGSYNVTVTVTDGRGGERMSYVIIEVRANRPPTITSLVANAVWTLRSGSLNVTCDATDTDGDELSYEWVTDGGDITGTGTEVIWSAPAEVGIYYVTVVAKDGHGREDTRSVSISVVLGTPPTIEDLVVTAREPKYLRTISAGAYYKVGKSKQYDIECIVSDTSGEVSYEWSCEDGTISGGGSVITWTAPGETLTRTTVTVIVSDIAGNKVSKSIDFQVVSCNSCTFG
ncbi:MAG TPA: PKD domain-containing protein [Dehalococcoidales bacterium]|nr:PKD domain-containing protein [Dehalococcoidales bacterium]